jgi:hypothetical protein
MVLEIAPGFPIYLYNLMFSLFILSFGYFILETITPWLKFSEKILYSIPTVFFWIYLLFLVNIILDGYIFDKPIIITSISFVIYSVSFLLIKEKIWIQLKNVKPDKILLILFSLVLLIYCLPIICSRGGMVWIRGDMKTHITFISQILLGRRVPSKSYQGIPNLYPWLFHAIMAYIANIYKSFGFNQIKSVFLAYNTIEITNIFLGYLSLKELAGLIFPKNKTRQRLLVLLTIFSGGLGFIFDRFGDSLILGDIIFNHPYVSAPIFVAPVWPRHLSYTLYLCTLYTIFKLQSKSDNFAETILLGLLLGIGAIIQSIPYIIVSAVLGTIMLLDILKGKLNKKIFYALIISVIIISPWGIPFLISSIKSGTASTTVMEPIDLNIVELGITLGVIGFFLVYGLYSEWKTGFDSHKYKETVNIFSIIFIILIILSITNSSLGMGINFFYVPILRQHKYWSMFYIFLAIYATIGLDKILEYMKEKHGEKITFIFKIHDYIDTYKISFAYKQTLLMLALIILLTGSPIYTAIKVTENVKTTSANMEFTDSVENELMLVLINKISKYDTVSVPPEDLILANDISCFTGAYIMYTEDVKIKLPGVYDKIPSEEERMKDTLTLYGNSSYNEKKEIIDKYNIKYVISINEDFINGELLFSDMMKVLYRGIEFNLHTVT